MEENLLKPTEIVRSNRKSLSLVVNARGELIVRAPMKTSENKIYDFIRDKAKWIIEKRTKMKNSFKEIMCEDGEIINLLGNEYKIQTYINNRVKIIDSIIFIPKENSKTRLINFLIGKAKSYLKDRVKEISERTGLNYKSISINKARTRWGSCSYDNKLNFSFRLLFCEKSVIDYIIIHELSHTIEKNHSAKFWKQVQKNCYNYKIYERWLKDNKNIMNLI